MKIRLLLLFLFLILISRNKLVAQTYFNEIKSYQDTMNVEFANAKKSPLNEDDLIHFQKLDFYNIDSNYRIIAKLNTTPGEFPFPMKTTTSRKPMYVKYGEVSFQLNGVQCKLNIYQNLDLIKKEEYKDYLFMPFTDLTNGFETYGGGRYLDLKIPEADTIVIDFNKCYNPYCAYNHKYSCPIPPDENSLNVEIKAGVKAFKK